jgi:hypothetical protein
MKLYTLDGGIGESPIIFHTLTAANDWTKFAKHRNVVEYFEPIQDGKLRMYSFDLGWAGAGTVLATSLVKAVQYCFENHYDIDGSYLMIYDIEEGVAVFNAGDS